jgi:hypothetical protein
MRRFFQAEISSGVFNIRQRLACGRATDFAVGRWIDHCSDEESARQKNCLRRNAGCPVAGNRSQMTCAGALFN